MAKIGTELVIKDNMTSMIESMTRASNALLVSIQRVQQTSVQIVNVTNLHMERNEITNVAVEMNHVEAAIQKTDIAQQDLNKSMKAGSSISGSLVKGLKDMAGKLLTLENLQNAADLSDKLARTKSKLNAVNDGSQSTDALNQKIFESSQRSHTPYFENAGMVASMMTDGGSAFQSNEEAIAFTELMSKQMSIDGVSADDKAGAMSQMTQAMAAGVIQGDALNSVLSVSPGIAANIEEAMGWASGSLQDYADKGMVTADVVRNSMFQMAGGINESFGGMNRTFEELWGGIKDQALWAFKPLLESFNELANGNGFQTMIADIINGLSVLGAIALKVFEALAGVAGWIAENWSIIAPLIVGVIGAMLLYNATQGLAWAATMQKAAASAWAAVCDWAQAVATAAVTLATEGLNAALAACPLTWIIAAIILVIAVIFAVVAAINKVTGKSISAIGVICGAILVLGAFIMNQVTGLINGLIQLVWTYFAYPILGIIEWILNVMNGGFNGFGGAVANLIGQIIGWFLSLGKVVTTIIDAIFGTKWTKQLDKLQDSVISWGKNDEAITLDRDAPQIMERIDYSTAWDTGYNFGANLKIPGLDGLGEEPNYEDLIRNSGMDALGDNVSQIADNTAMTSDNTSMSSEDTQYLRDLAERESINRFTTAELSVNMQTNANINSELDIDGVISQLEDKTYEVMLAAAEGV